LKLLCITDLHGQLGSLERILAAEANCDVILLGGDLTHFGTPAEAERIVLRCMRGVGRVFAVSGNCDSPAIDQKLRELDVSLFGQGVVWRDVGFYGVSAMPPWRGDMYELTEAQIGEALASGHQMVNGALHEVVLSHPPPHNTSVDQTSRAGHVGSTAVRQWIDQIRPGLVVCGHIHESCGVEELGPTTIVNCGPAGQGMYAVATLQSTFHAELKKAR